ncbi:MAG TPA: hypothetical protein VGH82_02425 [Gaiellaceae bacterium]
MLKLLENDATPVTLVAAPAGYGKTTLVSSWSDDQTTPVIWSTLDAEDREPVRMWTHLAAASSRARRGLGSSALE